jgi:hypothetical protein
LPTIYRAKNPITEKKVNKIMKEAFENIYIYVNYRCNELCSSSFFHLTKK